LTDYEIPSRDQQTAWQQQVIDAIANKTLKWSHDEGTTWILSGKCPRCRDDGLSNVIDFRSIVGDRITESLAPTPSSVQVEVVCTCTTEHLKDRTGCGWGKGLEISLALPEAPAGKA
jgi:hypothetical protein